MKTLKHLFMLSLFCMISIGASAAVYSGSCGDNAKWSFDTTTGLLSITGSGKMWDNYYSDAPWYNYRKDIISLSIGDQIISIGDYAFYYCSSLTSVTIPNSVTSIGDDAFDGCSGLTSVTIPNSVTSIGHFAFSGCKGLKSVTIPNSVTSIEYGAFFNCSGLTSVTIPNSVTSIGDWAFSGCSGLTSVTIPNSVTSIGDYAFFSCSGLTSIVVESGNMVYDSRDNCNAIIETASNTLISGCKNTTIPNSVTSIGNMAFYYCTDLTSVTIPNSVTSIGESAFQYCSGLTSVTIPNSVTSIGKEAFDGCYFLSDKFVNNSSLNAELNNYWGATICDIRTDDGLCIKDNIVVRYCGNGTSVTIPNSVTSIGNDAFSGCSSLTSVTIPNSVTEIGSDAFSGCSGLTSVTIPNSVTSIGESAFQYCSGLTSVTIPNSVTSIGYSAFGGCNNVKELIYAEGTKTALRTCLTSITSVTIPNSVTEIGESAFEYCSGLTSVTIPNSVTEIYEKAFSGCSGLTSVTIPNSVTSIEYRAFYECSGLTSVKVYRKRPLSIEESVWSGVDKRKCTLYVPEGTWTAYCSAPVWMDFVNIEEFSDEPGEEIYLTVMGVNGVILQQAVEMGRTYKYLLDNKNNGKIVAVTFNGEDVTADVTDGKYTTPKITGNSEIYVEYDNQPLGDTNLDGTVNVNDITRTAEIILLRAKAEMEAKAAMESIAEP